MAEEQQKITPIEVDYKCDECDAGYLRPKGIMLAIYPPQYPHECENCGATAVFREQYPLTRFVHDEPLDENTRL